MPYFELRRCLRLLEQHQLDLDYEDLQSGHLRNIRIGSVVDGMVYAKEHGIKLTADTAMARDLVLKDSGVTLTDHLRDAQRAGVTDLIRFPLPGTPSTPSSPRPPVITSPTDSNDPLAKWLLDQAVQQAGAEVREEESVRRRIAEAARLAKQVLHDHKTHEVNLPFIHADADGPKHLRVVIDQKLLQRINC